MKANVLLLATVLTVSAVSFGAGCTMGEFENPGGLGATTFSGPTPAASAAGAPGAAAGADGGALVGPTSTCPPEQNTLPDSLRCTGLYASIATKTIATGVEAYAPAHALWSDGAQKSRWVWLPPGAKIDTSNMDEWSFPVGTKFWKEFVVGGKRIETRMLRKVDGAIWLRTTYRWNADETDAVRFDSGADVPIPGAPAAYEIPASSLCENCHSGRVDKILGFESISLGLPGAQGMTLARLVADGRLSHPPAQPSFVIPDDGTGKAGPALGWLHANCGISCHNTSPGAACGYRGMTLKLSYAELNPAEGATAQVSATAAYATTYNVLSQAPDSTYMRIAPGEPARSAISVLAGRRQPGQMPPIATRIVDTQGIAAVNAWIGALR